MKRTNIIGLKERKDTPQVLTTSTESLNVMSLKNTQKSDNSKSNCALGCGCNNRKIDSISVKNNKVEHNVFVLDKNGKPITPTTNSKARKLMKGKQAIPKWNKFGQFGIQMINDVGTQTPKTVLGVDFGTKFEGYAIIVGKENNLAAMWLLPDKKQLVRKLEERKNLRHNRRHRQCGRREVRFDNRNRKGFITPSQMMMINSRLKCINEFFKYYPINIVTIEDVCFNHSVKRYGKNFSTIEVGKNYIYDYLRNISALQMYKGYDTEICRNKYGYKKSHNKSSQIFNTHCSDALSIAVDSGCKEYVKEGKFIVVDDTYRPIKRRLHDTQFSKGGIRHKYSSGNFKGVRKGTLCEHGQIISGSKRDNNYFIKNKDKIISRVKIEYKSHKFKIIGD